MGVGRKESLYLLSIYPVPCISRDTSCAPSWHISLKTVQGRRHQCLHVSHKKTGPGGSQITQGTIYGCVNLSFHSYLFHLCFHFDDRRKKNRRDRRVSRPPCHSSARSSSNHSPTLPHLCSTLRWPWTFMVLLETWRQSLYLEQYYTITKDSPLTFVCPLNVPSNSAPENVPFQRVGKFFYFVVVKTRSKHIFSLLLAASMFTKNPVTLQEIKLNPTQTLLNQYFQ